MTPEQNGTNQQKRQQRHVRYKYSIRQKSRKQGRSVTAQRVAREVVKAEVVKVLAKGNTTAHETKQTVSTDSLFCLIE